MAQTVYTTHTQWSSVGGGGTHATVPSSHTSRSDTSWRGCWWPCTRHRYCRARTSASSRCSSTAAPCPSMEHQATWGGREEGGDEGLGMGANAHTHIYAQTLTHIYMYTLTQTHTHILTHTNTYMYSPIHRYTHSHAHTHFYVYMQN